LRAWSVIEKAIRTNPTKVAAKSVEEGAGEIPRSGRRRATCHRGFWEGPLFSPPIAIRVPGVSFHDGFWFAELVPTDGRPVLQAVDATRHS
jgi:hypothetical protein